MSSKTFSKPSSIKKEVSSVDLFQGVGQDGKRYLMKHPKHLESEDSVGLQTFQLDPVSFSPMLPIQSSPVVFRITPGFASEAESVILEVHLRNTNGAGTITPLALPYVIERIELGVNGSPNSVCTITSDGLLASQEFLPLDVYEKVYSLLNQSPYAKFVVNGTNILTETAIGTSATAVYQLTLPYAVWSQLDSTTLSGDLILTIWPRALPVASVAGGAVSTELELSRVRLLIQTKGLHPGDQDMIRQVHAKTAKLISYVEPRYLSRAGSVFTAGIRSDIVLSGIAGHCAGFFVMVRNGAHVAPGTAFRTFDSLGDDATFDLLDAGGRSILGARSLTGRELRKTYQSFNQGILGNALNIYFVPLGDDVASTVWQGVDSGGLHLKGSEVLAITPGYGVALTKELVVVFLFHSQMVQEAGQLRRTE